MIHHPLRQKVRPSLGRTAAGKAPLRLALGALAVALWLPVPGGHALAKGDAAPSILPGGNSKEPVNIEADRLEYYNKEQKAIYFGNVVVVQGETSMKCSKLTIFINKQDKKDKSKAKPAPTPANSPTDNDSVRHMDADGPVTLVSKDQVGTGDRLEYDKPQNNVTIFGHVVLTQGTNVTKGDRLIYDLTSGVAHIESGATLARVSGYFVPGSNSPGKQDADKKAKSDEDASKPAKKGRNGGRTASRQKRVE